MSHRGKHASEAPQARKHNCHLSLHESKGGNWHPPLPPHLPCAKSPRMLQAASWGRHSCLGLKEGKSEPLFTWDKWPSTAALLICHEGSQHCISLQRLHPKLQPHPLLCCLLLPGCFSPWDHSIFSLSLCLKKRGYQQWNKLCWVTCWAEDI